MARWKVQKVEGGPQFVDSEALSFSPHGDVMFVEKRPNGQTEILAMLVGPSGILLTREDV